MARQPEIAGNIQTAAIILAALIEGVALFGLVIMFLIQSGVLGAAELKHRRGRDVPAPGLHESGPCPD